MITQSMKLKYTAFLLLFPLFIYGQTKKDTITFRVMSYNVENLFDCHHDTLKNDYEFLPNSLHHWNYTRYKKKLNNVARVITAVGGWTPPALVALCEVENDSVLRDLTSRSALRESGYRYVMTHSPDLRGIDVALLYQRNLFKLLMYQSISVAPHNRAKDYRPTRDILHVCGLLLDHDSLDVFVVHLPSRYGGAKASEPHRILAAQRLKEVADSIISIRRHPRILIMGDFNDYPENKSIRKILSATIPPEEPSLIRTEKLYHLLARKAKTQHYFGSYKFHGEWGLLDHLIVSGSVLQKDTSFYTEEAKADVFHAPFLLTEDQKYGGTQPFRTYLGPRYLGGYSDHLPVWADFRLIY